MDKGKQAKSLILGHLTHEYPNVKEAVTELGYGKEADAARKVYDKHYPPVPHSVELSTGAAGKVSKDQFRMRRYVQSLDRKGSGERREIPGQLSLDL